MPSWGLTPEQRNSQPWGLPSELLEPGKTLTDPVHGDIFLTKLEERFLDGAPMQRLRRIKQLGTTHLVYPGATHSRFSHALGALRSAQDLLDTVLIQRHGPDAEPDLFGEWETALGTHDFNRHVAEAIVLARLGALLHDLCHVPFGHSIEDDIGVLVPHDQNFERFDRLWAQFDVDLQAAVLPRLKTSLKVPLILKGDVPAEAAPYEFVSDLVGNTICADLLDYLRRDHLYAGLPASLGRRFLSGFYVTRSDNRQRARRMVVRVTRDGRARHDVVSEMFKYLRYRYELSERALVHHAKIAADAMVGKMLEIWHDLERNRIASELNKRVRPYEKDIQLAIRKADMADASAGLSAKVEAAVQTKTEHLFLAHGDDGLLEHIVSNTSSSSPDRRAGAVSELSTSLLNRRLYKLIGQSRQLAIAQRLYEEFGNDRERKRRLEIEAARFASIKEGWHVVLWIPKPEMRLKPAEVLVNDGSTIAELKDTDVGIARGSEIYRAHKALWAASVYVHPDVRRNREQCQVVLAYLAQQIGGISWQGLTTQPTVADLLAARVRKNRACTTQQEERLRASAAQISAHGAAREPTFGDLAEQLEAAAEEIMSPQGELGFMGSSE